MYFTRFDWGLLAAAALNAAAYFCLPPIGFLLMIGLTVLAGAILIPLGVAWPETQIFGRTIWRGATHEKKVALSFDDGVDPQSTPALLDLLRRKNVAAIFFCVGSKVVQHPELAAALVRERHLVGNHSYAHSNYFNFYGVPRVRADIQWAQAAIEEATGVRPAFFRPPLGLTNPFVFRVLHHMRMTLVGWTVKGWDTGDSSPEQIVARILRRMRGDSIIMLHDGGIPADRLVRTVEGLIDQLRAEGYEIIRLDELIGG